MKNSLMRKYRPQMILFLIIVIETGIFTGLVQYRNYIQKKQAEDENRQRMNHWLQ
ncbi:unknown [Roseburia sp. CAG:303]|nr:unknown [Roseburia sp. CAG:303]